MLSWSLNLCLFIGLVLYSSHNVLDDINFERFEKRFLKSINQCLRVVFYEATPITQAQILFQ